MNNLAVFRQEAEIWCAQNPGFVCKDNQQGVPELTGKLQLSDDQGEWLDTYEVKIVCTPDYPLSFPLVYETGGRIPVNIEWHVYPDGHACICAIPEEMIVCSRGITLQTFINDWMRPYFFNQKHREMHGFFLKERPHGPAGNIQFFHEIFKMDDLRHIAGMLFYIRSKPEPNRVQNCFCGSGEKYRRCHRDAFRLFRALPVDKLDQCIRFVQSFV
jgi:hypothetical protein